MFIKIPFLTWTGKAALEVEIPAKTAEPLRLKLALELSVKNGASLYGADLLRANLRGATLPGADLRGANLTFATLLGADLRGANLRGATLLGADLLGATLLGADLRGATLRGATLLGADLLGADLRGATLLGADLRGATLLGADLLGAILENGVTLVGARPMLTIGPIGSRNDQLFAFVTNVGIKVRAGCFYDTLDQFELAVAAEHGSNSHGIAYTAAIALIRAMWPQPKQAAADSAAVEAA